MRSILRILFVALLSLPTTLEAQIAGGRPLSFQSRFSNDPGNETILLPNWGIKTNLLWDAAATVNLGAEFRLGQRTSLDVPFNYNAWTFAENRKWKHFLVQPEFRWWTRETFAGHFFGLHAHYALFNVGNLPEPFSPYMQAHRFEGSLAGAGLSYGYRWNFDHRWALEATVGAGYAYMDYDRFDCGECGLKLGNKTEHYFGPTRAGITLIYGIGGRKAVTSVPVYVPPTVSAVQPYEPRFAAEFIVPEAEAVKSRSESGTAYLDFAVNRSEIVSAFRDNAAELQKIHTTIESVKGDPDATITGITITGYASPEGAWSSNQQLSDRRAQSLKNHIRSIHGLPDGLFTAWGVGEDWKGLDSLVSASPLPDKYRLLEIIRGSGEPDAKERRLREFSGGAPYRQLLAEAYPRLRRSDYTIRYTVLPFTVEKGKEVLRSRPGNLSLDEMFLIANTNEPGSRAFNEVFQIAAREFPESGTANVNAAAVALEHRDAASAARYLSRVKEEQRTPAYWNNLGILSWLQGDKQKAAECFAQGGEQGRANTVELEKHLRSVRR